MDESKETVFEQYYMKYFPVVNGYILKRVQNEQVAEDLTMDAFYSCWEKFGNFDESKASFQTWLFVIVKNKLKNYYRDRKDTVELDDSTVYSDDLVSDVVEALQIQYLRDHLYIALNRLNETQRQIVICKYFKNMNSVEIANQMRLSAGNVRVQLKRALDTVRDYFNKNEIRWE